MDDLAARLGEVGVGGFVRRRDVEARFGSSAYSLSGFEMSLGDAPSTLLVRAHLGRMAWWHAWVTTSVPRTARLIRLECVSAAAVELEVSSATPFPVRNALTELRIGPVVSSLSRYPDGGNMHTFIFTLTRDDVECVTIDDPAVAGYNPSNGQDVWQIGWIDANAAQNCEQ